MTSILKNFSNDELIHIVAFFPEIQDTLITSNITANANRIATKYKDKSSKEKSSKEKKLKEKKLNVIIKKLFKPSSYEGLKNISDLNLLTQFIVRKNILTRLEKTNHFVQHPIVQLFSDPLHDYSKSRFMISNYSETINDLTLSELYLISRPHDKNGDFNQINHIYDRLENNENCNSSLLDTPIKNQLGNNVTAKINLDISDEILEEKFSAYLKRKRRELGIQPNTVTSDVKKKLTPALISSIINNKVIPYLDLLILDQYINNEKTMTHSTIGNILFTKTIGSKAAKEKIKKSTSNIANQMMDTNRLTEMLAELGKSYCGIFDYANPPDRL